ncbi:MAG: DUF2834 domain-containing protein [Anaerolineae bacterium]|jgi:hypothetical protein
MRLKHLYIVLCLIGTVPYTQFIPWVVENGLNVPLSVAQIASSRLAAFGCIDVIVAALALLVFIFSDGRRHQVPGLWLPTVTVGVPLGLPLYLLLREVRREAVT